MARTPKVKLLPDPSGLVVARPAGVVFARAPGVIGWNEYVDFPEWDIAGVKAKVDTGARTSAIHVGSVRKIAGDRVRFDVVLHRKRANRRVTVEAPIARRTRVRSSTGHHRIRYVVPALVRIGGFEKLIEVSLVSRDKMLFRMLLGRSAFSGDFLIDASRVCLLGGPPETLLVKPVEAVEAVKAPAKARRSPARRAAPARPRQKA